ncbi:Protein PSK SIMULATOR [Heracleum sosnowskyi]|uniref:Protein PSK SIMULATOR n=1 Tax=Heracleum sosnowskyi TaxID=360622 RepID=A0AAD8IPF1_9APIA|nr:Protein PSK SIMULATOR [Heracleum sosnowskyi]
MNHSRNAPRTAVSPKGPQMSSFLGKAGIVGLKRAVDLLDTLGSSLVSLQTGSGITSDSVLRGTVSVLRGTKLSLLAFEVANTIVKGSHILQSISEENIQFLKTEILHSEAVEQLVSTDMTELLKIAAADKREEIDIFAREVYRFGDLCIDPQWHNLSRYSSFDLHIVTKKQSREDAETTMQELITLTQYTCELYHELNALDRFEQNYGRKVKEGESLHLTRRGEGLSKLYSELKHQRKLVKGLKKKSLWSKSLEEVVEKLVDIVTFIHQHILVVFEDNVSGMSSPEMKPSDKPERLGIAGLALHYAHMITQIYNIASCPTSLPPYMKDDLYNGLPISVKTKLRSQLKICEFKEDLSATQIEAQLEKTLKWLVPVATETTKAHQNFGWVGEWAYSGMFGKKTMNNSVIRLQTLYHADKGKLDQYILELVIWLHQLIKVARCEDKGLKAQPLQSTLPTLAIQEQLVLSKSA